MKNIYKYIIVALACLASSQLNSYAADDKGDKSNIKLFKTTLPTGNEDEFEITLNSFVTGTKVVSNETKPADITLVLDVSTSMSASQGNQYLLSSQVPLFKGDKVGYLHTDFSESHNHYNNQRDNVSRYTVQLNGTGTQRNMRYQNGKWQYYRSNQWNDYNPSAADQIYTCVKIDLLEEACRTFVNQIAASAAGKDGKLGTPDDIDHRIGFATFCGSMKQWAYITPVHTDGLQTMVEVHDGNSTAGVARTVTIEEFIGDLYKHQGGSTNPSTAFDQAARMYKTLNQTLTNTEHMTAEEKAKRSKVVVMFTDGDPTSAVNTNLASAYNLKAGFDDSRNGIAKSITGSGKVFTVGIFKDANAHVQDNNNNPTIAQYMDWMSSNYPNAQATNNTGNRNTDNVQYYQESDGSDLSDIFKSIAEAAAADTYQLGASDAAAIDVMSKDFTLPAGTDANNVTITQWVCVAKDTEGKDRDYEATVGGVKVQHKVRGGYDFIPLANVSNALKAKLHTDNPKVYQYSVTDNKVIVNGFDYSVDDVTHNSADGQSVILDTYGNWVGQHADGQPAGKMLEFKFKVKLKGESMGGYGLPSNEITSGIYANTGTAEEPVYSQIVTEYPLPILNVPSIIIIKKGLKYGDSAMFTVTKTDKDGEAITGTGAISYTIILSQTDNSTTPADCYSIIKDLDPGFYTVKEKTDWSWTYKPDTNYATEQTFELREPVIPFGSTLEGFKALIKNRQTTIADYGSTKDLETRDEEANRYYVTPAFTSGEGDDVFHLMFMFVNAATTDATPLHDEAFTVNVFGEGGGTAEHGGVDPEVPLGEDD